MKAKTKTFLAAIFMAMMLAFTSIGFVGCAPTNEDSGSGSGSGDGNYTVTFHYGFADGATYDADTQKPSAYKATLEKESKEGKKVTLTSADKNGFNVDGYTVAGYSTNAWSQNGITADLDVYVLYAVTETYTVTFKNPDGTVIKAISGLEEGESVADSDLPNTKAPVYSITATEYTAMNATLKALYQAYGQTGTYILTAEATRAESTVVIPRGTKFNGWTGSYANVESNVDVTAKTTKVTRDIGGATTTADVTAQQLLDGSLLASSKAIKTSILKPTGANPWLETSFTINNTTSGNITVDLSLGHGIDWKNGNGKETTANPGEGAWGYEYGTSNLFYLFIDGVQVEASALTSMTIDDTTVWNQRTNKLWLNDLVLTPGEHTVTFMNNGASANERPYVFGFAIDLVS